MHTGRGFPDRERLEGVARAALGPGRRIARVDRLRGGSKKGVYRLTLDDDSTVIVYIWDDTENYWPSDATAADHTDPFSHASGIDLFEAAHGRLHALGVRSPRIRLTDTSKALYPADIAVVEDVRGPTLEEMLRADPRSAAPVMDRLAEALGLMADHAAPGFGKVALVDNGGVSKGGSCEGAVLDRALDDLYEAARRDTRIAVVRDRLEDVVRTAYAAVPARERFAVVHGELGPDHVLVDAHGTPVLIDVEGLMYFDVEWEHAFLRIRFGDHYARLLPGRPAPGRGPGRGGAELDGRRLRFYALAMRLSLVAGPLRLLDGDFPDRDFMLGIVEHNLRESLAFLEPDRTRSP
ncbi:phosphotransferase [Streptomyces sp. NPDC008139]|uniref:phosphotransferase family protein n=1 Tax=Streptomyces sp. NPDC008139 TaxID=3364814 RepID=UPI0036EE36DE